ncbi:MAG: Crp/Fnr family transcriptional regulator [Leptolyngbya sp. SIOISBB]|nr:Crp/Fnr family transcriptional regulator [Leptolyngbya sp. SIOISBB]
MCPSSQPFTELLTFLSVTQIFEGLPSEQLAAIAQLARRASYTKGEIVFHQGDEGEGFYLVRSGRVKVFKLSKNGKEQILHIFGEGDHIAEVPAFDGKPFPASAEALEPTEVLFFPRQFFLTLLEQNPALAINMLKSFARHMRRFSQLVDNLSLREVPGRLATYLLQLSAQSGDADIVTLDLNKGQLAAMLGTIPETLSRVLYKLSREGAIAVEGNTIQILNRERLQQLSS